MVALRKYRQAADAQKCSALRGIFFVCDASILVTPSLRLPFVPSGLRPGRMRDLRA
jgi:hypothetical protein